MAAAIAGLLWGGQTLAQQPGYGRNSPSGRATTTRPMGYETYYGEDAAGVARAADGPEGPIE
jgi:hypothetical protein